MEIADTLNGFDWVVLSLVGILGLFGVVRGFTQEALSLSGWIGGAIVVRFFHKPATMWLAPHVNGEAWAAIIAFMLLFFGTVMLGRIIAGAAGGYARRSALGPMDRLLGLGFGALKGVILASIFFLLTQFATGVFDPERRPPEWLVQSRSAPLLAMAAGAMVGWVHDFNRDEAAVPGRVQQGTPFPLPPGAILPPGHPGVPGNQPSDGYSRADRDALDKLLEEDAEKGGQVEI